MEKAVTLGAVHTHTHTQVVLNNKKIGGEF
jgi:hypothetical protein